MTEDRRGWLAELRAALGEETAARMAAAAGGQRRHIPKGGRSGWIHREVGPEAALWMAERFGGEYLQLPLSETVRRSERRRWLALIAASPQESSNDLARRLGIHYRTVQRLRQSLRESAAEEEAEPGGRARSGGPDPRQLDLFED